MPTSALSQWLSASLHEHYRLNGEATLSALNYPPIEAGAEEAKTRFWRIDTNDEQFFLKRYKKGKTPERIYFEEEFQTRMYAADASLVPELIATANGQKHFELGADQFWKLERYVHSWHYRWWHREWQKEQCASAGRFLAKFHRVSRAVSSAWQNETYGTAFDTANLAPLTGVDIENIMTRALQVCSLHYPSDRESQRLFGDCRSLLRQSKSQLDAHTRGNADELLLVHGDFHMGNLLFSGDTIKGIVDYEDVRLQTRLYDLGYAAIMLCFPWNLEPGQDPLALDDRFLEHFLQAYHETDSLSSDLPKHSIVTACMLIIAWLLACMHGASQSDSAPFRCCTRLVQLWRFYV